MGVPKQDKIRQVGAEKSLFNPFMIEYDPIKLICLRGVNAIPI